MTHKYNWQRQAGPSAYLVAGDPSRTREIATEVSAVCDAHHGTWQYDIIHDRSMALQLQAVMRDGGGSPAEYRRVAAKYTQHTLDVACSMEGIVPPGLTDTLQAVSQDDGRHPQSGEDEADTIRLLGKKMGPPRPSIHSAPTATATAAAAAAAAVAGGSNDAKQAALAVVFQKLGGLTGCILSRLLSSCSSMLVGKSQPAVRFN